MNDSIARETLQSHNYLMNEVQNKAAIAYFAAVNRNLSLYNSLREIVIEKRKQEEEEGENAAAE